MSMDSTDTKKIILIDDDSFLLEMYTMKFQKNGFEVTGFNDPKKCLDKLREGSEPDIIISDLVMPGIDGWGFIKELREKGLANKSTVIVLSNQSQQEDLEKKKQYDVDGYIVKALATPSEVVEKVQKIYNESHK